MSLSGKQRRFLRAEAHSLDPLVSLGKEGITENLVSAVTDALLAHELIKVRVLDNAPVSRQEAAEDLPTQAKAELVGLVGRILILYKRHPHKPKLTLPREAVDARGPAREPDEDAPGPAREPEDAPGDAREPDEGAPGDAREPDKNA
jgi:RNA-binding protein